MACASMGCWSKLARTAAAMVETITADRPEMPFLGDLQIVQPAQSVQASLEYQRVAGGASAQNQGVGKLRIVIRQLFFKPAPVRLGVLSEKFHEPAGECIASLIDEAVAAQSPQVFMDADQAEGPGPGEVNSVNAGNACANSCPAIIWKLRNGDRPTPTPRAHSARP